MFLERSPWSEDVSSAECSCGELFGRSEVSFFSWLPTAFLFLHSWGGTCVFPVVFSFAFEGDLSFSFFAIVIVFLGVLLSFHLLLFLIGKGMRDLFSWGVVLAVLFAP